MLKKTLGVTLVTKLRAILLMEADFNATNKILYGVRMMGQARSYNLMPDEIYSENFFAYGLVNNYILLLQLCLFYTIYVGINNRRPTWDES